MRRKSLNMQGGKDTRIQLKRSLSYKRCPYACLRFGDCIAVCPQGAISIDDDNDIAVIDYEKCNGCGLCIGECSQNLIELVPVTTQIDFHCNYSQAENIPGRKGVTTPNGLSQPV